MRFDWPIQRLRGEIVSMRNQLIHGYLGIDLEIVWDVITVELPALLEQLNSISGDKL